MNIFDLSAVTAHRDRAARNLDGHDFLFREVADRLADRLLDVARTFPTALDIGCHGGEMGKALHAKSGVERVIYSEQSAEMLARTDGCRFVCANDQLPVRHQTIDLAISNLSLHWVNDLPGLLIQVRQALKPDGLFLAAMFGGETLHELRHCLMTAEDEICGGVRPRVSPFPALRDAGALMQRAAFALPVVDSDRITVTYDNMFRLLTDLRGMGETNALIERPRHFSRRSVFVRAAEIYQSMYIDLDGRIPATFDIIYLHGWAPHGTQQQPLKPGSAAQRLADALDAKEISAGEKPGEG